MVARHSRWKLASTYHKLAMDSTMSGRSGQRFLMWVDAVGGYLVCCGSQVVLGQAAPENRIDVPIQGDLARRHATLCRDSEGYTLSADAEVQLNGVPVRGTAVLKDGVIMQLGSAVKLRFRMPHPLSASAQLLPLSHHRTRPSTDGILLLADTCVIGPGPSSHIVARSFVSDVLLFRQGDDLRCRAGGNLEIDGAKWRGEGPLSVNSRVCGEHFSLSLENV